MARYAGFCDDLNVAGLSCCRLEVDYVWRSVKSSLGRMEVYLCCHKTTGWVMYRGNKWNICGKFSKGSSTGDDGYVNEIRTLSISLSLRWSLSWSGFRQSQISLLDSTQFILPSCCTRTTMFISKWIHITFTSLTNQPARILCSPVEDLCGIRGLRTTFEIFLNWFVKWFGLQVRYFDLAEPRRVHLIVCSGPAQNVRLKSVEIGCQLEWETRWKLDQGYRVWSIEKAIFLPEDCHPAQVISSQESFWNFLFVPRTISTKSPAHTVCHIMQACRRGHLVSSYNSKMPWNHSSP